MDQTVTPAPESLSIVTDIGPAAAYNMGWFSPTSLLIEANDLGGMPTWVTLQLLNEDPGLRNISLVNCCPFGPVELTPD